MLRSGLKILLLVQLIALSSCESKLPERKNTPTKLKPGTDTSVVASSSEENLFAESKTIMKTYCHQCHGQSQSNSGGLTNITDLAQKISQGLIVPGNPESSKIFERMTSKTSPMPPSGQAKPTEKEIETLKQWISQGAKIQFGNTTSRALVPEDKLLNDAALDLIKEVPNSDNRRRIRYLSIAAAQNAGASDETVQTIKQATAKLLNSLSRQQTVYKLKVSAKNPLLIRFSLDELGWTEQDWNKIVKSYPYQIVPADKKILAVLQEQMGTTLPVVRADWLIANASQPPLYYEILNSPEKFVDFSKLLGIDLPAIQKAQKIMRAGFNNSEVADFSRVIERVESANGSTMWHSYEFGSSFNDKNPFMNPFGPGDVFVQTKTTRKFNADGKEVIYTLPNNFLAFYVADQNGNRLNEAPTRARNSSAVSGVAIVGVACMSCHSQGLLEKRDQIRDAALKRTDLSNTETDLLKNIYPEPDTFISKIKEDTTKYQNSLKEAGVDISQPDPVSRIFKTFNDSVNLAVAAGELGVVEAKIKTAIENSQTLTNSLSALTSNGTISRAVFTANFQTLMNAVFENP